MLLYTLYTATSIEHEQSNNFTCEWNLVNAAKVKYLLWMVDVWTKQVIAENVYHIYMYNIRSPSLPSLSENVYLENVNEYLC